MGGALGSSRAAVVDEMKVIRLKHTHTAAALPLPCVCVCVCVSGEEQRQQKVDGKLH